MPDSTLQNPATTDPRPQEPKPEFNERKVEYPGVEGHMNIKPDHGEESYQGSGRLTDKVAIITGGDSGIGRAVAIAFAREGADVLFTYLTEEEQDANETASWVEKAGRKSVKIPGDLRQEQHCQEVVERAFQEFGKLDLLVHNAAFQMAHEKLEEFTTEEFDRTFKTNVYALFWLARTALPRMKPGSAMISTASIEAYDPSPTLVPYTATKAAIVNLTKTFSKLAVKNGVRVNAVAPGPVWTPLIPATMPEQKIKSFGQQTSFGRPAQPVEIAPLFVFLASNEARYVTGEVYGATGGQSPF